MRGTPCISLSFVLRSKESAGCMRCAIEREPGTGRQIAPNQRRTSMRNLLRCTIVACALGSLAVVPAAADAPATSGSGAALTGKMASMQYLVGSWKCDVKLPASASGPAGTDHGVVTYSVVPGNALHAHVTAADYAADTYGGYVDKSNAFWLSTIDAYGTTSTESSADGKVFAGSSSGGGTTTQIRDKLSRPATDTIRDLQEFETNGAWNMASDSTCTRV